MSDAKTNTELDDYGAWLPPVRDNKKAEQAEKKLIKASVPVIQEVLDWYDACIDKFSNPMVVAGVNVSTPAETVKEAVLHAQQQIASYQEKKAEFVKRFSDYIGEVPTT
jgi:hypothetical protein